MSELSLIEKLWLEKQARIRKLEKRARIVFLINLIYWAIPVIYFVNDQPFLCEFTVIQQIVGMGTVVFALFMPLFYYIMIGIFLFIWYQIIDEEVIKLRGY